MTRKTVEAFVRKVLSEDLNQKVSAATVRNIASKVLKVIPALKPAKQR